MLYIKDLTIQRGNKIVFSNFNAVIKSGSTTLIKGKNGSGKSTLLRAIAGFTPLERGTIKQDKKDIFENNEEWVENLIFLDTKNGLSKDLTVAENLNAWLTMKGWSSNKEIIKMAIKSVGMEKYADLYISQCSEGLKKRAALSRLYISFINKVDFWILDEPTNELDTTSLVLFKKLVFNFLEQKGTIIIASHDQTIIEKNFYTLDLDELKKQRVS